MDTENNQFPDLDSLQQQQDPDKNKKEKRGYFCSGLIIGLASALIIVSVAYLGTRVEKWYRASTSAQGSADTEEAVNAQSIQKLQTVEGMIRQYYYYDDEIDTKVLEEGAYRGMIESLGDPYSTYYSAEELEELRNQTQGVYYGIGAGVSLDTETTLPKIVKVYDGTPAKEAGLREDDIIYEVNGESTYGMSTSDVVALIKGEENTSVNLTIVRAGESDYLSIDVTRRKVNVPTVEFKMLNEDMAYIQISEFDDITVDQFAEALAMARGNNMKGLVLDLRSNPGGSLDAVVEIARMLLPEGLIVYTEDKYENRKEYTCDGTRQLEVPMTVLINGNSASASEILAGAIKDYGIGTLVGTTTYGKGIVQSVMPLTDGSAVKLTISSYFTPKGNNIHKKGIEPDVICEFDGEAYYGNDDRPDNQLEKAKEVLGQLIGQ